MCWLNRVFNSIFIRKKISHYDKVQYVTKMCTLIGRTYGSSNLVWSRERDIQEVFREGCCAAAYRTGETLLRGKRVRVGLAGRMLQVKWHRNRRHHACKHFINSRHLFFILKSVIFGHILQLMVVV